MKSYSASRFKKLTLIEQVQSYIDECEINLKVEKIDPDILSDIGDEGLVFDDYVVYLARGKYEFDSITGKRMLPGFHVWKEIGIAATQWSPPDSDVIELITCQRLEEAVQKVLETVIQERIGMVNDHLADSEAAEAEEEYDRLMKENENG